MTSQNCSHPIKREVLTLQNESCAINDERCDYSTVIDVDKITIVDNL